MSKITVNWYMMQPFRQWANACHYMSAGFFACLHNSMVHKTGDEFKYNVQ